MTSKSAAHPSYLMDMEPVGRRVQVKANQTVLGAARAAGVGIVSLCGGDGWCEGCIVRIESGGCQPVTEAERLAFSDQQLAAGYRLACQAIPTSDLKLYIPSESLSAPQRLQIEGQDIAVPLEPLVHPVDLALLPPTLYDLVSDSERVRQALANAGYPAARIEFPLLKSLSNTLRELRWNVRLVLRQNEVIAVLPSGSAIYGYAVDIGTTKLAGYLIDLTSGETVAKTGAMNPQIAYGEDVISRITYSRESEQNAHALQSCLLQALDDMLLELRQTVKIQEGQVVQSMIVGNTAMHHLFAGLPVNQLALSPYTPAVGAALALHADRLLQHMAPGGYIQMLPNIAGYVGADHVAAVLASQIWLADEPTGVATATLLIDIGTNTEISLAAAGKLYCCSCASGPAFEGAHIRHGMRAAPGAIESCQILSGQLYTHTIGGLAPVGICGSGILDIVAELRKAEILDRKGAFQRNHANVQVDETGIKFVLNPQTRPEAGQENSKEISISRRDVNEIQLAKAAIRSGIDILLESAQLQAEDIKKVVIAGAFGTYIRIESAIRIGMLPDIPIDRYVQVGNAAGMGAKLALISSAQLAQAEVLAQKMNYVELTTHPDFQARFLRAMYL